MNTRINLISVLIAAVIITACGSSPEQRETTIATTTPPLKTETPEPPTATQTVTATMLPSPSPSATVTNTPLLKAIPTSQPAVAWKFVFPQSGELWLMEKDAEARVLVKMGGIKQAVFSPDGEQVVYTRIEEPSGIEIWSVNSDGSGLTRLTGDEALVGIGFIGRWSFSPDGSTLVFGFQEVGTEGSELWTAMMNGSGVKKLVSRDNLPADADLVDEPDIFIFPMSWIPNSSQLLIFPYSNSSGKSDYDPLLMVDVETGKIGEFLPEGSGGVVSFSPDDSKYTVAGKTIVTLYDAESHEILSKLSYPDVKYRWTWEPDVNWAQDSSSFLVALPPDSVDPSEDYSGVAPVIIWSVGGDGSEPVEMTRITAEIFSIVFSPDLDLIAYDTREDIVISDLAGSTLKTLTPQADGFGMSELDFSQWSPDSSHFAYLAGDNACVCGIDIIADTSSNESIKLQDKDYLSGYLDGFIIWLDVNNYLYFDYPESSTAVLVLAGLDLEKMSWPGFMEPNINQISYWLP